ncbi:MAG: copper chaperone PCu(A)C [Woeseia sp.]
MILRVIATLVLCTAAITACKPQADAALVVSNAYAYAPLGSGTPGVAYLTLSNTSSAAIEVQGFASDCFATVELHSSVINNGVSAMQAVEKIPLAAMSSVSLRPGGLHLMLFEPVAAVAAGTNCQFEITYEHDQKSSIAVTLLDRSTYRPAEPVK